MKTVDEMIADIIRREGGYNDVKNDKGGATNLGVSLRYLRGIGLMRGDLDHDGDVDKDDIRLVTPDIAAKLYKMDFFFAPRIDKLPQELQPQLFDEAVNMGCPRAIMLLQSALAKLGWKVQVDGVNGPFTTSCAQQAVANLGWKVVNNAVVDARRDFYDWLVSHDPTQAKFKDGWLNRAEEFRA